MNNTNIAKDKVIAIVKEAKYRYQNDVNEMVAFLNKTAKEYVQRSTAFADAAFKRVNLMIAREIARIRDQLTNSINKYMEVYA